MAIYLQGFYEDFGFTNSYDPWSSFFLNMENGNQIYKINQLKNNDLGINCEILCYCFHHDIWEKVFLFYRSPSKSKLVSRFTLCNSNNTHVFYKKIIHEFFIKDSELERKLGDKAVLRTMGDKKNQEINANIPDLIVEKFFADLLININSKKIKFEYIDSELLMNNIKRKLI
jgi:hypothetical protein